MSIKAKDMTMAERKEHVAQLVRQFKENEAFYLSKNFVESEVRNKFIDPLLECLKWDVKNEKGARHDRQEVITEDRVVMNGQVKHPDYTLCYGGERKMYVEAKQPSVDLKTNPEPALQVRRYAYTSKMPIAVLTDFQELAIYDTRIKPSEKDTAATARIEYLTYDKLSENFESLYNKISWDAVDLGTFDTYYEGTKDKRGTATVDDDILNMIEKWRMVLAEDIALHNEGIDEFNLTGAVQKIIDRILFLRICEDKEIEEGNRLKKITAQKTNIYKNVQKLFENANAKFNAGLFASDTWLDGLAVADKTLISIINALYYPECQYEFSVLPVEILGSIYERFLGKIIRFTRKTKNGHSIEIIEKPEVQKAGGVYYTPPYIVKYIVESTIGKKLEGKTPDEVKSLRFVDPACGSGSFLVGAYQYLLDWHLDWYYAEERRTQAEKKGLIYKDAATQGYKLSIEEKKRILLNNIYGVDIDAQAVEVTKLSLFLKLLENEGKALSTTGQAALFRTSDIQAKILPDMSHNIKCGNSLIGTDYYAGKDLTLFGIEDQRKVNAFDWDVQFPDIFAHGGFDCVIGNPPYVKEYTDTSCFEGLHNHPCYQGKMDLWYFFGYQGIRFAKENGLVGFIAPNNWITNAGASLFRNFVLDNAKIVTYTDFGNYKVFQTASIQTMIYIMQKMQINEPYSVEYSRLNNDRAELSEVLDFLAGNGEENITRFEAEIVKEACKDKYILFLNNKISAALDCIKERSNAMLTEDEIVQGIIGAPDECFIVTDLSVFTDEEREFIKPYYTGLPNRYSCQKTDKYIIYLSAQNFSDKKLSNYPNFVNHFNKFKTDLKQAKIKYKTPNKPYYYLHRERDEQFFKAGNEKIISQGRTQFPRFYYTTEPFYASRALFVIKTKRFNLKFLTAVLNSNVIKFWLRYKGKMQGDNFQVDKEPLLGLPLIVPTEAEQIHISALVDQMIAAQEQLNSAISDSDKKFLQQRVDVLDKQINAVVYGLYGLTSDEVKVVEGE